MGRQNVDLTRLRNPCLASSPKHTHCRWHLGALRGTVRKAWAQPKPTTSYWSTHLQFQTQCHHLYQATSPCQREATATLVELGPLSVFLHCKLIPWIKLMIISNCATVTFESEWHKRFVHDSQSSHRPHANPHSNNSRALLYAHSALPCSRKLASPGFRHLISTETEMGKVRDCYADFY